MMQARTKGARFEHITRDVLRKQGHTVGKRLNAGHDAVVNGSKDEIKGSTLNLDTKNEDKFSFMQIRPDQDYDRILFVMFYPNDLVIMHMDKALVLQLITSGVFNKQHGGNSANSRTFMYYGNQHTLAALGAIYV
jgi:hypothetical protein